MNKKFRLLLLVLALLLLAVLTAQGIGVSLAYFIPRNGYFSNPIAPLSLRDVGITFGNYFGLSASLTFYSVGGMGLKDEDGKPIGTDRGPFVGPFHTILASLTPKIIVPIGDLEIVARGGVFGFHNIDPLLLTGNLDRYIAAKEPDAIVNSNFDYDGRWGWGWVFGGTITYFFMEKFGVSVGALYYLGGADMHFSGDWDGESGTDKPVPDYLKDVKLDFSGLELIVGGSYRL